MKHLDLVIPTRHRLKKLQKCLDSLEFSKIKCSFGIIIVTDGDDYTADVMRKDSRIARVIAIPDKGLPMGSVYCRNLGIKETHDGVSWGVDDVVYDTDDVVYKKTFIDYTFEKYNLWYPDDDGIMCLNVLNDRLKKRRKNQSLCGMGVVGRKVLERFPDGNLFFPGYFHFSCQEITRLGKRLGKIKLAEDLKVFHKSPAAGYSADRTHYDARIRRRTDLQLSSKRKHEGKVWGLREESTIK